MRFLCLILMMLLVLAIPTMAQPAAGPVGLIPWQGPPAITTVTLTTSSSQVWPGGAVRYLRFDNVSASAVIWCKWAGTPVANAAGTFEILAGASRTYADNFLPNAVLNCLGSAAATGTIETN